MKIVIVDIDNTLWDFHTEFEARLREINPELPPKEIWQWDTPLSHVPKNKFYRVIDEIHQNQKEFAPYPEAEGFLQFLKNLGCEIWIASHRRDITLPMTVAWLKMHRLYFNSLYLCEDKTRLFDQVNVVVDDCPETLEKAKLMGLIYSGLRFPWNKHMEFTFESFSEMTEYLSEKLNGGK